MNKQNLIHLSIILSAFLLVVPMSQADGDFNFEGGDVDNNSGDFNFEGGDVDNNSGDTTDEETTTEEEDEETDGDLNFEGGDVDNNSGDFGFEGGDVDNNSGDPLEEEPTEPTTEEEEADFQVTITDPSTGDSFEPGDDVRVDYTVENDGDLEETQIIEFYVNGQFEESSTEMTLDEGEAESSHFNWDTSSLDEGSYDLEVASYDDFDEVTVDLEQEEEDEEEDANFEVEINEPSEGDSFEIGEEVNINYGIENTGDVEDNQDIELTANDDTIASGDITLDGGESGTWDYDWDTSGLSDGDYELELSSEDTSDSVTISLSEDPGAEPNFEVQIDEPVDDQAFELGEDEEVTVEYTVENTGDQEGTQNTEFFIDGNLDSSSTDFTLDSGETTTGEFTWDIRGLDEGSYDLEVSSDDTSDDVTVNLLEDGLVELEISTDGEGTTNPSAGTRSYPEGQQVEVEAFPEDDWSFDEWTGDLQTTSNPTDIEMDTDKQITANFEEDGTNGGGNGGDDDDEETSGPVFGSSDSISVGVDPDEVVLGESTTVSGEVESGDQVDVDILLNGEVVVEASTNSEGSYEATVTPDQLGENEVTARTSDDESSTTVNVVSSVSITSLDAPSSVNSGQQFDVCVETVADETPEIELFRNGESVGLNTADSQCFEQTIDDDPVTDYRATATVGDEQDEATTQVSLEDGEDGTTDSPEDTSFTGAFLQDTSNILLSVLVGILVAAGILYRSGFGVQNVQGAASNVRTWFKREYQGLMILLNR